MTTKRKKTPRTATRAKRRLRLVAPKVRVRSSDAGEITSKPMLLGYARVSTVDQNLALQRDALTEAGCTKIFTEQMSGAVTDRPALHDALEFARSGDTLIVWKLDRLARSMKQLIETVETLRLRGIGFRSLTEALDTTTAQGRLVFHMFGALAEFERSLIRERTQAGLAAARRAGRREAVRQNSPTTTSRLQRRCWPTPTSASPKSRTASASHRRRCIGTSRPREPRIRRAFDNGRSTPKTGPSRRVSAWRGRRQCADSGHSGGGDRAGGFFDTIGQIHPLDHGREAAAKSRYSTRGRPRAYGDAVTPRCCRPDPSVRRQPERLGPPATAPARRAQASMCWCSRNCCGRCAIGRVRSASSGRARQFRQPRRSQRRRPSSPETQGTTTLLLATALPTSGQWVCSAHAAKAPKTTPGVLRIPGAFNRAGVNVN